MPQTRAKTDFREAGHWTHVLLHVFGVLLIAGALVLTAAFAVALFWGLQTGCEDSELIRRQQVAWLIGFAVAAIPALVGLAARKLRAHAETWFIMSGFFVLATFVAGTWFAQATC